MFDERGANPMVEETGKVFGWGFDARNSPLDPHLVRRQL
jgi:hypothetical protein